MKTRLIAWAFLAALSGTAFPQNSHAADQDDAKLFGSLPNFGVASLSPSGNALAFSTLIDGKDSIVVFPLEPGVKPSRFGIADSTARRLIWHDDNQIIATLRLQLRTEGRMTFGSNVGTTYSSFYQDMLLSARGDNAFKRLDTNPGRIYGGTSAYVEINGKEADTVYFSAITAGPSYQYFVQDLYRLNLASLKVSPFQKSTPETVKWFMDGTGQIVARLDTSKDGEELVYVPDGKSFKKTATIGRNDGQITGLTQDGKSLALLSRRDGDRMGLYRLNLADGSSGGTLFAEPASDVTRVLIDEHTFRVLGVAYDDGNQRYTYFDPDLQKLQKRIEDVLPGRSAYLISMSGDRSKVAVVVSGPQNPPSLQLVNLKTNHIDEVAQSYPQLSGMRLGEVRRQVYTSADGKTLVGLLTLPAGKEPRNLPAVVLPPGGFSYTERGFDWFAQYLAHRGYAVFQSGARSLKGVGDVSGMDEFGTWMNATQQDVARGVDDLVAKGIVDPKRVCIAGAGSEGYIALSATLFAPDKYACAIDISGFSDIKLFFRGSGDSAQIAANIFGSTFMRNRREYSDADLERFSPARHANAIQKPILIVFGERDRGRVQGNAMNEALLAAGKPVDFITLVGEDGSMTRSESRTALLNAVDKFLTARMGN